MADIDKIKSFKDISCDELINNIKLKYVTKFYEIKIENPNITKKDICKILKISLPTLNKYFRDTNMDGFVQRRRKTKSLDLYEVNL